MAAALGVFRSISPSPPTFPSYGPVLQNRQTSGFLRRLRKVEAHGSATDVPGSLHELSKEMEQLFAKEWLLLAVGSLLLLFLDF
ncbi:hypothetical protein COCNU_01G007310 [Cocos nucifera]|uniref:Uncharacterized protein n=1 Tax=Cocos nucifera TaxID=13894 RepID=A0A8K0HUK7_COCNU|nr:hypothetical protein COCNU_01G007310 [Cocos nucifera]